MDSLSGLDFCIGLVADVLAMTSYGMLMIASKKWNEGDGLLAWIVTLLTIVVVCAVPAGWSGEYDVPYWLALLISIVSFILSLFKSIDILKKRRARKASGEDPLALEARAICDSSRFKVKI